MFVLYYFGSGCVDFADFLFVRFDVWFVSFPLCSGFGDFVLSALFAWCFCCFVLFFVCFAFLLWVYGLLVACFVNC